MHRLVYGSSTISPNGVASACRHSRIILTHYTDMHDVDEDLRTDAGYGGYCTNGSMAGAACRQMYDSPSNSHFTVASKK